MGWLNGCGTAVVIGVWCVMIVAVVVCGVVCGVKLVDGLGVWVKAEW